MKVGQLDLGSITPGHISGRKGISTKLVYIYQGTEFKLKLSAYGVACFSKALQNVVTTASRTKFQHKSHRKFCRHKSQINQCACRILENLLKTQNRLNLREMLSIFLESDSCYVCKSLYGQRVFQISTMFGERDKLSGIRRISKYSPNNKYLKSSP